MRQREEKRKSTRARAGIALIVHVHQDDAQQPAPRAADERECVWGGIWVREKVRKRKKDSVFLVSDVRQNAVQQHAPRAAHESKCVCV